MRVRVRVRVRVKSVVPVLHPTFYGLKRREFIDADFCFRGKAVTVGLFHQKRDAVDRTVRVRPRFGLGYRVRVIGSGL